MFNNIFRAFRNDVTLYPEIKGNAQVATQSWIVLALALVGNAFVATLVGVFTSGFLPGIFAGMISVVGSLFGYVVMLILAWVIGILIAKGTGTFTDLHSALAHAYSIPAILAPLPYVGFFFSLWLLVTASSAIRETLGISKGLTFFIVILSIVGIFAISASIGLAALAFMPTS